MKTLKELSNNAFYDMGNHHQITIDFVEDTEILFDTDTPTNDDERNDLKIRLEALSYSIDITNEIFNPDFDVEISILKNLDSLIEIRIAFLESMEFKTN